MTPSPPIADPLLELVAASRTHGMGTAAPIPAVRSVDLTISVGEFIAVTGPSGAGKSTLLHMMAGLYRPDSGEIRLRGRPVHGAREAEWAVLRRSFVGIVFQSGNLLQDLTVADNVELPALLAGSSPRAARERRRELLDELKLSEKATSSPGMLSGGERQRVALARALVNRPALLLADEPTGSLDSRSTGEVLSLLTRHHQDGGTIVLVTHDARVASSADRVISLFDGRIVDDARLADPHPGDGSPAPSVSDVIRLGG